MVAGVGGGVDSSLRQRSFEDVDGGLVVGDDDVRVVGFSAAGERHVYTGGVGRAVDIQQRVVNAAALRGMRRLGVAEFDVLADIRAREGHAAVDTVDGDRTVTGDRGDGPFVAVVDVTSTGGDEVAVVAAGDDPVTDMEPIHAGIDEPGGIDVAVADEALLRGTVQLDDCRVRRGRQQHVTALGASGVPHVDDGVDPMFGFECVDAVVPVVDVERVGVAAPQGE